VNQDEKHLSVEQIEALLDTAIRKSGDDDANTLLQGARRHLASCQACQRLISMHERFNDALAQLRQAEPTSASHGCPPKESLTELAAGLIRGEEEEELVNHALQCAHCGPLLREATELVGSPATEEEGEQVAALRTNTPPWQAGFAQKLAAANAALIGEHAHARRRTWLPALPRWTYAAAFAAALLVAFAVSVAVWRSRPGYADGLLADAYTERRTLEVRIPGAKFAPVRVERGAGASSLDKPPSLLKAEDLIGESLRKTPSDPNWLQAKARADLLDGNYESAIQSLKQAQETAGESPTLLTDLGSAYFLRAEAANHPIDYGNAIEFFSEALAKSPDDSIALFNRALTCERMFLYTQAVDDWEHYLRLDAKSAWAEEARRRLAEVQQKLEQRQKSLREPLLTPQAISQARKDSEALLLDKLEQRVEEYLKQATMEWLPAAFAESPSPEVHDAVYLLADLTKQQHGDAWLADVLSQRRTAMFRGGLIDLASAVKSNESGDYAAARPLAHKAAQLFQAAGSPAGELRAEAEEVYSDHLLWEGAPCLALLDKISPRLEASNYSWLQGQMSLERSNCADQVGDLGAYKAAIAGGIERAQKHNYDSLFLRGLGFRALAVSALGDADACFSLTSQGLASFWAGHGDVMKGYNFYSHLDAASDGRHLSNFQVAVWREASDLLEPHPNVLLRAMAHRWYANAAYLANNDELAEAEFSKAGELFAAAPQTPATTRNLLDAEVWWVRTQIRRGNLEDARLRLGTIRRLLDASPSFDPAMGFYSAEAEIAIRGGNSGIAESALRSGIYLAEQSLKSLRSEDDRRRWAEQTQSVYRGLVEWRLHQGDTTGALEFWEWYRGAAARMSSSPALAANSAEAPLQLDPRNAPPLPMPSAVAAQLPSLQHDTVIAYATFPDGISLWAYDDRGLVSRWISVPFAKLQEESSRFERLCADSNSSLAALQDSARSLYALLLAPIEGQLQRGRTLFFEPDDSLVDLPWEALMTRDGHYLAERFAVVLSPGLYSLSRLRSGLPITSAQPALLVSVPEGPDLPPLSDARAEAELVASKFSDALSLSGTDATLDKIREELRRALVFHFAGHAVSQPPRQGLVLAERDPQTQLARLLDTDSFRPGDTEQLQLAVLSACNTAREAPAGSGAEGLSQSLLAAGVPHVVASRWNVDSVKTAEFMKQFYEHLLAGNGVADALRSAELALASNPSSAHPYYWAAFGLHGTK
jgi:CHAT domain-containing protein/tetratricopeptide (TPR) repeat protein